MIFFRCLYSYRHQHADGEDAEDDGVLGDGEDSRDAVHRKKKIANSKKICIFAVGNQ